MKTRFVWLILLVLPLSALAGSPQAAAYDGYYGWPVQKAPARIIVCDQPATPGEYMLLESLAGLAAQAVNEGKFDALVWIDLKDAGYQRLYDKTAKALGVSQAERFQLWELAAYLKKKQVLKGYVLYRADQSEGGMYRRREGMDLSSNAATVYGAVLKGVLIDEALEQTARRNGLRLLKDCRQITMERCFEENKERLNNRSALAVDPKVTNCRSYAMAHKMMLYYDTAPFSEQVLEWVRPLSPIMGWNCGGEDEYTGAISRWGHYNTASNWCHNLTVLASAYAAGVPLEKANEIVPWNIDFTDNSPFHSYVMSDGDNMQWTIGNFIDSPIFYANSSPGSQSISWTLCPINLSVISPFTWNTIAARKPSHASLIEYGGGYQYPDQFAINRPNRTELLTEFARRIGVQMERLGVTVFGFICKDVDSDAAKEAYSIYAREIPNLTGMLAVQYYPYELGGEILWVKNRDQIDIPVVTASYSMWDAVDGARPNAGTPEYVSSLINRQTIRDRADSLPGLSWTIVHAWSHFGPDNSAHKTDVTGANAITSSQADLIQGVKQVSANELLWRIRMRYRPEQTRNVIEGIKASAATVSMPGAGK